MLATNAVQTQPVVQHGTGPLVKGCEAEVGTAAARSEIEGEGPGSDAEKGMRVPDKVADVDGCAVEESKEAEMEGRDKGEESGRGSEGRGGGIDADENRTGREGRVGEHDTTSGTEAATAGRGGGDEDDGTEAGRVGTAALVLVWKTTEAMDCDEGEEAEEEGKEAEAVDECDVADTATCPTGEGGTLLGWAGGTSPIATAGPVT